MNLKKNIKNISYLWIGSLLGSGSTFLIYILLARKLSPNEFGIFSSALALLTIFILIGGFGISQFWLKIFGKEGWGAIRWIKPSLQLLFINLLIISILISLWAVYGPHEDIYTKKVLLIMILFVIGQIIIELVGAKFQLEEKYLQLSIWQLLPNIFRLVFILIVILIFEISIIKIALIYSIISILFIIIGIYLLFIIKKGNIALVGHVKKNVKEKKKPTLINTLSESWAFGLAGVFSLIYLQSDIILVKYIIGNKEAAYYNASFIILSAILIFPTIVYQKFLMPKIHRWANNDKDMFYNVYKKGNIIMFTMVLVIMIILLFISEYLIPLVFGENYINAILLTKILAISIPMTFLASSIGSTLVTTTHIRKKVGYMGIVAIINIILNLYLIPIYGSLGAAWATVSSNLLLLILYYIAVNKYVFNKIKKG
jgi:O-antigen/teichoic acid export membrane protein